MRYMGSNAGQTYLQAASQSLSEILFERLPNAIFVWSTVFLSIVASSADGDSRVVILLVATATLVAATFSVMCANWIIGGLYRLTKHWRQRQDVLPEASAQLINNEEN
jgi:hypothetical protein